MNPGAPTLDEAALSPLAPRLVAGGQGIARLRRLSGGASQESWAFDVIGPGGPVPLILRRAPGEHRSGLQAGPEIEAAVIGAVARHGVPVPPLVHVLAPADGLGRGFVTGFVEGETIGARVLRSPALADARTGLAEACGTILARIHAVPRAMLPPLREAGVARTVADLRADVIGSATPRPVFALALRWLEDRQPAEVPLALVHGDFRNGNLIVGPDGVRAVLDWELVHLGDPAEDLGWLCVTPWRFGAVEWPVGGFGARDQLFAGHARAGGMADPARVRWWETAGSLRWGLMCDGMLRVFRDGIDRSPERAMIARRASESEADLLRLLVLGD